MVGYLAWAAGMVLFAIALARALPREALARASAVLAGTLLMIVMWARASLAHLQTPEAALAAQVSVGPPFQTWAWKRAELIGNDAVVALSPVLLALLALSFAHARGPDASRERSRLVLMSAALATYFVVSSARRAAWSDPVGDVAAEHVQLCLLYTSPSPRD